MKHEIQIEDYTREADGRRFVRVVMSDLAGVDTFRMICTSETPEEALIQLAHRLKLASEDAKNISGQLFEKYWVPDLKEVANGESHEVIPLRLVETEGKKEGD